MPRISRRNARARGQTQATVSLTPLIDTALTLLVIFMVATPMMHRGIKVELPKGHTDEVKQAQKQQDLVVYVDKKKQLYLNGKAVTQTTLLSELKLLLASRKSGKDETVIVKGDGDASYDAILSVVDTLKHAGGITYVALATQKPRES